jgi:AcrR family transcriptional regulator
MPAITDDRRIRTEQRRRRILEAALQRFTTAGFAATTMEDIRTQAHASTGSLYHHFSSKERLAADLYIEGLRDYQTGLLHMLRRQREAQRGVRAIVAYHLRWVRAHPEWARYLLEMAHTGSVLAAQETIRSLNEQFFRAVFGWLEPHVNAGDIIRLAPELYAAILIGPSQELARHWLRGGTTNFRHAPQILADAAWNSLHLTKRRQPWRR